MAGTPANSFNQNSTSAGIQNWDGVATPSTTALVQFNVVSGASTSTVNNISPSTSGFVLTSNGLAAQPTFQAIPFTPMTWTDENASFNAVAGNGYFVTNTATATLPPAPSQGNTISFILDTALILTIQANTGQIIRLGKIATAAAGTAKSNFIGDAVTLIYRASDTTWLAQDSIGTWTLT